MCVGPVASRPTPPPPPPTLPVAPVQAAIDQTSATRQASGRGKKKAQAAVAGGVTGGSSTILTGGLGLTGGAQSSAKKTLLGQ